MTDVSKSGVFFDLKNGKVVDKEPEEGVQLVPAGAEITPDLQEDIDRWTNVENGVIAEPQTVTTSAGKKKA